MKKEHAYNIKIAKTMFQRFSIFDSSNTMASKWNFIRQTTGIKRRITPEIKIKNQNSQITNDPFEMANMFAEYFSTSSTKKINQQNNNLINSIKPFTKEKIIRSSMYLFPVTDKEIIKIVDGFKNSASSGVDDLSSKILKGTILYMADIIA